MKIYVASSWRNQFEAIALAKDLRSQGHKVDCFCEPKKGRFVFHFTEIKNHFNIDGIEFLKDSKSQKAFKEDKKWIDWADAVVMLLPCGKSSHLEAGYAVGKGKKLYIIGEFPIGEFDVMYGFADKLIKKLTNFNIQTLEEK